MDSEKSPAGDLTPKTVEKAVAAATAAAPGATKAQVEKVVKPLPKDVIMQLAHVGLVEDGFGFMGRPDGDKIFNVLKRHRPTSAIYEALDFFRVAYEREVQAADAATAAAGEGRPLPAKPVTQSALEQGFKMAEQPLRLKKVMRWKDLARMRQKRSVYLGHRYGDVFREKVVQSDTIESAVPQLAAAVTLTAAGLEVTNGAGEVARYDESHPMTRAALSVAAALKARGMNAADLHATSDLLCWIDANDSTFMPPDLGPAPAKNADQPIPEDQVDAINKAMGGADADNAGEAGHSSEEPSHDPAPGPKAEARKRDPLSATAGKFVEGLADRVQQITGDLKLGGLDGLFTREPKARILHKELMAAPRELAGALARWDAYRDKLRTAGLALDAVYDATLKAKGWTSDKDKALLATVPEVVAAEKAYTETRTQTGKIAEEFARMQQRSERLERLWAFVQSMSFEAAVAQLDAERASPAPDLIDAAALMTWHVPVATTRPEHLAFAAARLTTEQITKIHQALQFLARRDDGAVTRDDRGFSKEDTEVGRTLAGKDRLTPMEASLGRMFVLYYVKQLTEKHPGLAAELKGLRNQPVVRAIEVEPRPTSSPTAETHARATAPAPERASAESLPAQSTNPAVKPTAPSRPTPSGTPGAAVLGGNAPATPASSEGKPDAPGAASASAARAKAAAAASAAKPVNRREKAKGVITLTKKRDRIRIDGTLHNVPSTHLDAIKAYLTDAPETGVRALKFEKGADRLTRISKIAVGDLTLSMPEEVKIAVTGAGVPDLPLEAPTPQAAQKAVETVSAMTSSPETSAPAVNTPAPALESQPTQPVPPAATTPSEPVSGILKGMVTPSLSDADRAKIARQSPGLDM